MAGKLNTRATAAKLAWQIIDKGQSLDAALGDYFLHRELSNQDRALTQELVYGVCRWYGELNQTAATLLKKPIRKQDRVIHHVLLVGLYQLRHLQTARHAAVAETVAACQQLNKPWAKNLVNGCLRSYLRTTRDSSAAVDQPQRQRLAHPTWMVEAIENAWSDHANTILAANNQRPAMCLRVNQRFVSRDAYLIVLANAGIASKADPYCTEGVILDKAVAVAALPNFANGAVSVQDSAAQLACGILNAKPGHLVLDACAAPGGKTAHLLERADTPITLHALDISEHRCAQLHNTLERLQLVAEVFVADACKPPAWPVPELGYDRILIDAPCSGLGVIRRHPDIKHHRRPDDILQLNKIQQALLNQLWFLLKPGGLMLYMTCSILPSENREQVEKFIATHTDARLAEFAHPNALALDFGKQTLPGVHGMDGFYYCLLKKQRAN